MKENKKKLKKLKTKRNFFMFFIVNLFWWYGLAVKKIKKIKNVIKCDFYYYFDFILFIQLFYI